MIQGFAVFFYAVLAGFSLDGAYNSAAEHDLSTALLALVFAGACIVAAIIISQK